VTFLGSLFSTGALWTVATVNADVCIEPYAYLNTLLNGGNSSASTDPDNIATFYASCTDATAGPVNANINAIYATVAGTLDDAVQIRAAVSGRADVLPVADALIGNITVAESTINATRLLVDCRVVHEVSELLLDQLCDTFVPVGFWYAITMLLLAVSMPVLLIVAAIPLQGEEPASATESDVLLVTSRDMNPPAASARSSM
jgi:hypothetical protein